MKESCSIMVEKEASMLILDREKLETQIDQQRYYLLQGRIKQTKDSIELDPHYSEKGRRFHDDERIAYMIMGYIVDETRDSNGQSNYTAANLKFLSMDTNKIDIYIDKAVKESAGADYYYTYEKEY